MPIFDTDVASNTDDLDMGKIMLISAIVLAIPYLIFVAGPWLKTNTPIILCYIGGITSRLLLVISILFYLRGFIYWALSSWWNATFGALNSATTTVSPLMSLDMFSFHGCLLYFRHRVWKMFPLVVERRHCLKARTRITHEWRQQVGGMHLWSFYQASSNNTPSTATLVAYNCGSVFCWWFAIC